VTFYFGWKLIDHAGIALAVAFGMTVYVTESARPAGDGVRVACDRAAAPSSASLRAPRCISPRRSASTSARRDGAHDAGDIASDLSCGLDVPFTEMRASTIRRGDAHGHVVWGLSSPGRWCADRAAQHRSLVP
jgi:hypothetical protein